MAYQGLGSELWTGFTDSVPKTRTGYFLPDLHVQYSVDQSKEIGSAVKVHAQTAEVSVPQSQADSNADQPVSVTASHGSDSQAEVRVSSASNEVALAETVSTAGVSSRGMAPGSTPSEPHPEETVSPTSQCQEPKISALAVPSVPQSNA